MAFVVSSLPEYVEQHKGELLTKTVFGAPSVKYLNLMTGVKHKQALNILATNPALQERACSFNASGNVTFTQREMTVGRYMVNVELCPETLAQKWMNNEVMTAAGAEVLPFEEKITSEIVDDVKRQIEGKIWTADSSAESNPDLFDGLLTNIVNSGSAIAVTGGSDIYDKVKLVYLNIPVEVLDRAVIFMGVDTFRSYIQALVARNMYHYTDDMNTANLEVFLPGTNTKIVGVSGLNGTDAIVAADPANLFYGVDMANDEETFDLWYSKDNQTFRLVIKFNAGSQIAFPDQIAYYVEA